MKVKKMVTPFIVIFVALLGGCVAASQDVKGIGSGSDGYKKSPCACGEPITQPNARMGGASDAA